MLPVNAKPFSSPRSGDLVSNWGWQVKCWAKHAPIIHSLVLGWGKKVFTFAGEHFL